MNNNGSIWNSIIRVSIESDDAIQNRNSSVTVGQSLYIAQITYMPVGVRGPAMIFLELEIESSVDLYV